VFVLTLQPIPFAFCALKFGTQPGNRFRLLFDQVASGMVPAGRSRDRSARTPN
jgi:hypothetical protein